MLEVPHRLKFRVTYLGRPLGPGETATSVSGDTTAKSVITIGMETVISVIRFGFS